jgi:deferrochelatase/peroxidase EfeB
MSFRRLQPHLSRRALFGAAAAVAASPAPTRAASSQSEIEPFYGPHQGGILTPAQRHTYFAAFDLTTDKKAEVIDLLRRWTNAAARMSKALPLEGAPTADAPSPDAGDAEGLSAARLTITFGFGAGLFSKGGVDRYGLAASRPPALVDMPNFPGDQLVPAKSDGDLSVQACADDPQVAFHAIRQLAALAYDTATHRWLQAGFNPATAPGATPRNLMGFKDGSRNPDPTDARTMDEVVWVGAEGPAWMQGGSYVVYRRSRIALEHWDRTKVSFQEQTIGREKHSGAPLGGHSEHDPSDFNAEDADGNPVIPENSHVRLAAAENNDGARIFRRAFSFDDGVSFTAERWPPWRQANELDAGLLFVCYQRDPRTGFIKLFERMAKFDMMNQFVTNTASALFAVPGGVSPGRYVGQSLFEAG